MKNNYANALPTDDELFARPETKALMKRLVDGYENILQAEDRKFENTPVIINKLTKLCIDATNDYCTQVNVPPATRKYAILMTGTIGWMFSKANNSLKGPPPGFTELLNLVKDILKDLDKKKGSPFDEDEDHPFKN